MTTESDNIVFSNTDEHISNDGAVRLTVSETKNTKQIGMLILNIIFSRYMLLFVK
jgi:hypothetical protein